MTTPPDVFDPKLDLELVRTVDVPPQLMWKAWTTPKHLLPWFCPKPWMTVDCEIDLRPGGIFRTVMRSPEGQDYPNLGCYLDIVENKRLIWTDMLGPGYRPARGGPLGDGECGMMTAILTFAPEGKGTRYVARALHQTEADRKKHEDMGFEQGWGTCLDQLVAYIKQEM
ncbi:MAG: SRPBCC family protein [Variibacter sp.]